MASVKTLRRQNRIKTVFIAVLVIVIVVLAVIMGVFAIKQYQESKKPVYEYVSMTEEASARAFVWLSKIEDTDLSYDDVKACMGEFNLELVKTPTEEKGKYDRQLADGAYEYLQSQATVGLEKAYRLAVTRRIQNFGYEGTIDDALVEKLMKETFGLSVSEYLKQCDITLLPTKEELTEKYAGEVSDEDQ